VSQTIGGTLVGRGIPMLLLIGVALFFAARASASESSEMPQDVGPSADDQAALVAEGEALFNSVDAFGQRPSEGAQVAGLKISCATCHPGPAFTDGKNHVVGPTASRDVAARQTPHLLRLKDTGPFSWDGRNETLQQQIRGAIVSPLEMNSAREPTAFELDALAAFVETLDAPDAVPNVDFDPALAAKGEVLFNEASGKDPSGEFEFFTEPVSCATCHSGDKKTDRQFHKILLPMGDPLLDPGAIGEDGEIKGFKTPVLRGLRLTAPYFHEGLAGDPTAMRSPINEPPRPALTQTVAFYNERFLFNFSPEEQLALVEYLMSL
jgi:cytochrome c peroxidase